MKREQFRTKSELSHFNLAALTIEVFEQGLLLATKYATVTNIYTVCKSVHINMSF